MTMRPAIIYLGYALGGAVVGGVGGLVIPLAFAATDPHADTISPVGVYLGPWLGGAIGLVSAWKRIRRTP